MKISSIIPDHRIEGANVLIEISYGDYLKTAKKIVDQNDYQRKKVIKGRIREFLKKDLIIGCTIPPIVLSIKESNLPKELNYRTFKDISLIEKSFSDNDLIILDGLQRTHVLMEVEEEIISGKHDHTNLEIFHSQLLRIELYVGLNKINILYRMLTLNTGQTTMSTRHLMEILYLDYVGVDIDGIKLILDKENKTVDSESLKEFKFKDILDGFNSFLEKNENLIARTEILDNIKALDNLESLDKEKDLFKDFLKGYHTLLTTINQKLSSIEISIDDYAGSDYKIASNTLFGSTPIKLFKKSQSLSGFGATVGTFIEFREGFKLDQIHNIAKKIHVKNPTDFMIKINSHLDYIKEVSKKIGNDQRLYFKYFFKDLLDPDTNNKHSLDTAAEYAYKKMREEFEF